MARNNSGFAKRLIALRNEKGVSQFDFGKALGIPRSTISGYEIEGKEPDFETLSKMADYFNVSADFILGRSDENRPCDIIFHNDASNFKTHYESLPKDVRDIVSECFDKFYVLLHRDVCNEDRERLSIYLDMLSALQSGRADIRNIVDGLASESSAGSAISSVVSKQSEMKSKVDAALDALLDSDLKSV